MECPQCGLINPVGSESCDCGFDLQAKALDTVTHRTLTFHSSAAEATRTLLATLGFSLLIVTAAWAHARVWAWILSSLRMSDGTTIRFTGEPARIWALPLMFALVPMLEGWMSRRVFSTINAPMEKLLLALLWSIGVCLLYAVVWLKMCKWIVSGAWLSSATRLYFDGGLASLSGQFFFGFMVVGLIQPTSRLSLLLLPLAFHWSARWMIDHVHSAASRLRFIAPWPQTWWRVMLAMAGSIMVFSIPFILIWLYKWVARNIVIEHKFQTQIVLDRAV